MRHLSIIDADSDFASAAKAAFEERRFQVQCYPDARSGLDAAQANRFDLLLLDVLLPDRSGLEVCREIRHQSRRTDLPMLIVSTVDSEEIRVRTLQAGADGYVAKPVTMRELLARAEALLRRCGIAGADDRVYADAELVLFAREMRLEREGERIGLTAGESEVLELLMRHAPVRLSSGEMAAQLSRLGTAVKRRTIESRIKSLRAKIGRDRLECSPRIGYAYRSSSK